MRDYLLLWLAFPLVAIAAIAPPARRGFAAARLVALGFGVAALHQGVGTINLADLRQYAAAGSGPALFVSLTVGLIAGGILPRPIRDGASWMAGLPLLAGLCYVVLGAPHVGGLLLGTVLGTVPAALAVALSGPLPQRANTDRPLPMVTWVLPVAAVVAILTNSPMILVALLVIASEWAAWLRLPRERSRPWPVLPLGVSTLLIGATWLAVTVAGDPLIGMLRFAEIAPVSGAAERLVGLLLSGALVLLVAPWPLHRLVRVEAALPVTMALGYAAVTTMVPEGMSAWSPLVTGGLVLSLLSAGMLGMAMPMVATLACLGTLHSSVLSLAGAAVLLLWVMYSGSSATSRSPAGSGAILEGRRWEAVGLSVGATLVMVGVLRDEVVLGTLLAAGVAFIMAWRPPWLIAPTVTT